MAKILLVDDDELVRRVLRTFLERGGHRVAEAGNGLEALDVFRAETPDLVLTDILMPRMNGLEMIVELRRAQPGVRVIAMTGSAHDGDTDAMLLLARDLGATRTFRKPLDMTALLAAVDSVVSGVAA